MSYISDEKCRYVDAYTFGGKYVDAYTFGGKYVEFDLPEGIRRFALTYEQAHELLEKLSNAVQEHKSKTNRGTPLLEMGRYCVPLFVYEVERYRFDSY